MKTVCIIEGFSGGPKLTKKFREALRESDFDITKRKTSAEVIFAHSAGVHAIPKNPKAKLIVLVDPPYWPEKRLRKRFRDTWRSIKEHDLTTYGRRYYLRKRLHQTRYSITRPKYLWIGVLGDNRLDFLKLANAKQKILLIRNTQDTYCSPAIREVVKSRKQVAYIALPGYHDDFTTNPRPYIELINKYLQA